MKSPKPSTSFSSSDGNGWRVTVYNDASMIKYGKSRVTHPIHIDSTGWDDLLEEFLYLIDTYPIQNGEWVSDEEKDQIKKALSFIRSGRNDLRRGLSLLMKMSKVNENKESPEDQTGYRVNVSLVSGLL